MTVRMRIVVAAVSAATGVLAAGPALAQFPFKGYLGEATPDTTTVVAPPPGPGSPQDQADRAIFLATRQLEGGPRWAMAIADNDSRAMGKTFACSLGAEIGFMSTPKIGKILIKVAPDLTAAVDRPKLHYQRKRPYFVDEGKICIARDKEIDGSFDYPSGHASWGWAVGLILAELAPDRAAQILQRARAFGESRVVCGVHSASAVEAGRLNGTAVVTALHGSADFRADMDAARGELAALRAKGKPVDGCEAEAAVLAAPAW